MAIAFEIDFPLSLLVRIVVYGAISNGFLRFSFPLSLHSRPRSFAIPSPMENQELLHGRPTFGHSDMYRSSNSGLGDSQGLRASDGGNYRDTMSATRPTEMKIVAMEPDEGSVTESVKDYKGRIRVRETTVQAPACRGGSVV